MKKILFLGAAQFQTPPIVYSKKKGYQIITCDNQPNNPGHKLANKSYNISTIDQDSILKIAIKNKIDGILSYGSDVSTNTASYVADKMNISGSKPQSIKVLTNKSNFRSFLIKNNLQKHEFKSFNHNSAKKISDYLKKVELPQIIKPIDASGSRGISVINNLNEAKNKIESAFSESVSKTIIIEKFISKKGSQICGDGWMENGKLKFVCYGDGHFYNDSKFPAPFGETFPSHHSENTLSKVSKKLEEILSKSGYSNGPFNLDVIIDHQNNPFVIEIGPRNGGNYIPNAIKLKTNVDLISATVELALNKDFKLDTSKKINNLFFGCYMINTKKKGKFQKLIIDTSLEKKIIQKEIYIKKQQNVLPFYQANNALGNIILKFKSKIEMNTIFSKIDKLVTIKLK